MTVRKLDRLKMLTISHNRFLFKTIPSLLFQKQLHHGAAFFVLSFETKGFQHGDNKHLNYTQIAHTPYIEFLAHVVLTRSLVWMHSAGSLGMGWCPGWLHFHVLCLTEGLKHLWLTGPPFLFLSLCGIFHLNFFTWRLDPKRVNRGCKAS